MRKEFKSTGISNSKKQKIKEFIVFLVLTSIIWLLMELSKNYTSTVVFNASYTNLPAQKLLQNKPDNQFVAAIKAPGFSILRFKLLHKDLSLSLSNIQKVNRKYVLYPNKQLSFLNSQLPSEVEIVRVLKDSVFFDLGTKETKKIAVLLNLNMKFKLGFGLIEPLNVVPDSVIISGPNKFVDSINIIETEKINLEGINKNISQKLQLLLPFKNKNIQINAQKVKVIGKVDKFTEGTFNFPVKVINKPKNVAITTLPEEIEVIYQTGLTNYSKITPSSVDIVFDYNQYKKDTTIQYLSPKIVSKSNLITSVKINPNQIQFFIKK
ncbi:MAG: CdaR family protein [Lutibacter sp.]